MTYKLLIADDERMERDALRYVVTRGCPRVGAVYDAANGREAVETARDYQPEIVLLDIKMPGINGVEAATRILGTAPGTKVVFLTAYDYFDYAQQAIRLGVADFIVKPVDDERVVEVINAIVAQLDDAERSKRTVHHNEQRLKQARCVLEEALVSGLVRGDPQRDQIDGQLEALDLQGRFAISVSVLIDFASYPMRVETESQRSILRRRCVKELKLCLQHPGCLLLVAHRDNAVHLLLVLPEGAVAEPSPDAGCGPDPDAYAEAVGAIRRRLAIRCSLGVDTLPRPIDEAWQGFRRAVAARSRAAGQGPAVAFAEAGPDPELADFPVVPAGDYADELERQILAVVRAGDGRQAPELAARAIETLHTGAGRFTALRRRVLELVIVIARELDLDPGALSYQGAPLLEQVESAAEVAELQHVLRNAVAILCSHGRGYTRECSHGQIERARKFIGEHYRESLTLETVAAQAQLSAYYFTRVFKIHTGYTFIDYLNSVRVAHAKGLLRQSGKSVKEIAWEVGFSDANYFSRVFKHHTDATPTQYRSKTVLH